MQRDENKGLSTVYWAIGITIVVLAILAGVLWWYDGYVIHGH